MVVDRWDWRFGMANLGKIRDFGGDLARRAADFSFSSKLNFQIKDLLSGIAQILSAFAKYCPQNENTVRNALFTVRSRLRRPNPNT